MTRVYLNRIGTAVPRHDVHAEYIHFGRSVLGDDHARALWDRMAEMADIEHRFAVIKPAPRPRETRIDEDGFYTRGAFPGTAARMRLFEQEALRLALQAVDALDLGATRQDVTHLIVACCTGFTAPGLDFQLLRELGLRDGIERTIVGFMGCFAAVNSLRLARHIVRSEPDAVVLVINVELSSLHLQEEWELEKMLSFLLFGDGCSASLVSARPEGLELGSFRSAVIPDTAEMITWHIGDTGFLMHLSGQVPGRIRRFLLRGAAGLFGNDDPTAFAHWAVHAGGRSILDAVQHGLALAPRALDHSRAVLRACGNMSSATLPFVLDRIIRTRPSDGDGVAMAFGPGLSVESFRFRPAA